ncbi:MAG TPA: hypothetical protein VIP09_07855 [Dehalococcoidia bacterium]
MDSSNRLLIVFCASAWIVAMAVIVFLTWAAPDRTISRLGDFVQFLSDNNTDAGKLVVTLAALAAGIIGLLVIVVEVAPDAEPKDLRVEQAGATLIIPADALRVRLEEALLMLPDVTAARTHVWTRDKGIATSMELTVPPGVNLASVTQEAVRVVVEAIQTDLGLPVSGVPPVKIAFGGSRSPVHPTPAFGPPTADPAPMSTVQTVDERISSAPTPPAPSMESHADSSPGPLVYDETPSVTEPPSQDPHSQSFQP